LSDMKDYYQILGVTNESSQDDIRRRYRKLAMEYHPDRNPGDAKAEEQFKTIAEAYGVLTDPVKRKQYDLWRKTGAAGDYNANGEGFQYSQEDILRDLFKDQQFQQLFQGLLREFQRSGFRASPHFIKQSFFGGRGKVLFGGLFLFGSIAGPHLIRSARKNLPKKKTVLRGIGDSLQSLLNRKQDTETSAPPASESGQYDVTYLTPLSSTELEYGKVVRVVSGEGDNQEMLKVTIPAGSRDGQKLRLRGKGRLHPGGRGDLYLQLKENS